MESKNEPQEEYFIVPTNVDPNWMPPALEKMVADEDAATAAKAAADAKAGPKKWTCRLRERVVCDRSFSIHSVPHITSSSNVAGSQDGRKE